MAGTSIYRRLTGRKRTLGGFTQLWLAPDHILLVRSTRFMEYYQRFSLADIQAIVLTEIPKNWMLQTTALAVLILAGVGFIAVTSIFAKVLMGIFGAAALAVGLGDVVLGPRCVCHLHTEVSRERLRPVSRWSTARNFLQMIRPAIEAVQGSLTAERAAAIEIPDLIEKPPAVPNTPGYLPEALFILFLVDAALVLGNIRFPQAQLSSILFTTVFGEIVILIVALARRVGRDARRIIYAVMILAVVCIGVDAYRLTESLIGWMNGVVDSAKHGATGPPPSIFSWVAFSQSAALFAAGWRILAGTIGLAAAWLERGAGRT